MLQAAPDLWNLGAISISSETQQSFQIDMATENHALVLIDPLNDFIHPKGKLFLRSRTV